MSEELVAQLSTALFANNGTDGVFDLPEDAPFDPQQREWLNGLLTGITALTAASAPEQAQSGTPLAVCYGSQSGNAEVLARDIRKFAATQGFEAAPEELNEIALQDLAAMSHVLIICSTFGEGEPPDNARAFWEALMADDAPSLPSSVNFSVCGLGDSSYAQFNQCASDIHRRLCELGATPVSEMVSCDTAFEDDYADWRAGVFASDAFVSAAGGVSMGLAANEDDLGSCYTKQHPFLANLVNVTCLNGSDSAKCVNHVEISLAGGGEDMHYEAGDALGLWPLNAPDQVSALLEIAGFTGREVVSLRSGQGSLRTLMLSRLDICTVNAKTLEVWAIDEEVAVEDQVIDVLTRFSPELDPQSFVDGLRPLQPRLYSIASSPAAHPGEVHLSVAEVHYDLHDRPRHGVASTFLGQRLGEGSTVGVYIQKSAHFHLPANDDTPLIMIGPGTGIAPFRAFLEEREARQAGGRNWLFFGDQHERCDYLYQDQLQNWQESGLLSRLSLAWSRDGDSKVYVQDLIARQAEEFFNWLEAGAAIYICGDASRMAVDVDRTIRQVVAEQGSLDEDGVNQYMSRLVSEHRYQRDVY